VSPPARGVDWHCQNGRIPLINYGWALLSVWAFWRYLEQPDLRRGAWLGALAAPTLQGSFSFGYLLGLALGTWWARCLAACKIGRAHFGATVLAALTFAVAGFGMTFPVWTIAKGRLFADDYFHRPWNETGVYGAELWQYLMPQGSSRWRSRMVWVKLSLCRVVPAVHAKLAGLGPIRWRQEIVDQSRATSRRIQRSKGKMKASEPRCTIVGRDEDTKRPSKVVPKRCSELSR
jgi:hypothetical protein